MTDEQNDSMMDDMPDETGYDDASPDDLSLPDAEDTDAEAVIDELSDAPLNEDVEAVYTVEVTEAYDPEDPEALLDTLVEPVDLGYPAAPEGDDADDFIDDLLASTSSAAASHALRDSEDARPAYVPPVYTPAVALPPMTTLRRGRLGSVVPALALIGIGAWLTLTLTSGGSVETPLLLAVVFGATVLSLMAQWLGSGRWSRGTLVIALIMVAVVVVFILPLLPGMPPFPQIFPLLAAAVGVALIMSGLLARPAQRRAFVPGALLIVMGAAGTLLTTGILPEEIGLTVAPLWAIPVVFIGAIWLVPLVFRRRRG
ncbi:hypothetical protein FBR02_14355 [Anaerolineae bacterium CFX9]|nr:hypothetical protein [Anaerolineae bacterium CFX9]